MSIYNKQKGDARHLSDIAKLENELLQFKTDHTCLLFYLY